MTTYTITKEQVSNTHALDLILELAKFAYYDKHLLISDGASFSKYTAMKDSRNRFMNDLHKHIGLHISYEVLLELCRYLLPDLSNYVHTKNILPHLIRARKFIVDSIDDTGKKEK